VRTVVVTGAATGIGYATARSFSRAGDQVIVTGRREQLLKDAAASIDATAVAFDAADPDSIRAALPLLPAHVDVLVNNAGGNTDFDHPEVDGGDLTALAASWRHNLDANLMSAVLVTAALTPRLRDNARVVTIGSIAARQGAGSYGAAKAAVEAWTASVARELGPRGITANVVAPGFIETDMTADIPDRVKEAIPARRAGTPEEVAACVAFLASDKAGYVNGTTLYVDGGLAA